MRQRRPRCDRSVTAAAGRSRRCGSRRRRCGGHDLGRTAFDRRHRGGRADRRIAGRSCRTQIDHRVIPGSDRGAIVILGDAGNPSRRHVDHGVIGLGRGGSWIVVGLQLAMLPSMTARVVGAPDIGTDRVPDRGRPGLRPRAGTCGGRCRSRAGSSPARAHATRHIARVAFTLPLYARNAPAIVPEGEVLLASTAPSPVLKTCSSLLAPRRRSRRRQKGEGHRGSPRASTPERSEPPPGWLLERPAPADPSEQGDDRRCAIEPRGGPRQDVGAVQQSWSPRCSRCCWSP